MKKSAKVGLGIVGALVAVGLWLASSYNGLVGMDEGVRQAWAQVENVYQRRMDLIPNLVESVKGAAGHEKSTLMQITQARSRAAGSISSDVITNPALFQEFQESQAQLSSALSRLMVVVESYPALRANENFLSLQAQLEGTENRISVERGRFNEAAQLFNVKFRKFPTNFIGTVFGFKIKEYFRADAGAEKAPQVKF